MWRKLTDDTNGFRYTVEARGNSVYLFTKVPLTNLDAEPQVVRDWDEIPMCLRDEALRAAGGG
jgi:hypothetical protein